MFKLGAAAALVLGVGAVMYFYTKMDDQVRRYAEETLAEHFPHLDVSVGGARIVEGHGIALYDVDLSQPAHTGGDAALLVIDELLLECDAQIVSLVAGPPEVRRLVVKRPRAWLRRETTGRWNIETLLPLPKTQQMRPTVVVQAGAISLTDKSRPQLPPLDLREVHLTCKPLATPARSPANATRRLPATEISGTFSGPRLREAHLHGRCDGVDFRSSLQVKDLRVGGDLWKWIAAYSPRQLAGADVDGRVDGAASFVWQPRLPGRLAIGANLSLTKGRIQDQRLPRPITDLSGKVVVEDGVVRVEELRGKCGSATFALALKREGLSGKAPLALAGQIANLPLDSQLYKTLPAILQSQWDKYQPAGVVHVDSFQAVFDGQRWRPPAAVLSGSGLSFESDKFPYRLVRGSGTLQVEPPSGGSPSRIDLNLTGYSGQQPVRIVGQVFDPRPGARGWIEIAGNELEVDKAMIDALEEKPRQVLAELHPRGTFNVFWRLDRKTPGGRPQTHLRLELVDISVNYDRFPYPLRGVRGLVQADNQHWTFQQLESGGRRSVQCEGRLVPSENGSQLELTFSGNRVPLDDDLFGAVSPQVQRAWTELRAKGHVDFTARVSHLEGEGQPRIWTSIRPLPETASIQPKFFDYEMDDLSGEVTYEDGDLELIRMKARHDDTLLSAGGSGHFAPGGGWQVQLTGLTVDRLRPARDLLAALPPKMAITIDALQPRGSFSIYNGVLDFRQPLSPTAPIESRWDVQLDCHQADVHCGVQLKNVHGTLRLRGGDDGNQSFSTGELNLETAVFEDVQFTNIQGPFWVNEAQCRFGRWANRGEAGPPRRLTAEVFGGSFAADGGVDFRELPHYRIEASVVDADLVRMITERFGDESEVTGKADANVVVEGKGRLVDGMVGTGNVHVHDADIYESPILLRLLKTLRYGKRDATAFTEVNATFRMEGRHIYLSQLDFLGDVVNLYGEGYTNFDHDLKLRFHGQVGRNKYLLPVVKHVVGEVNRQIMEVYVDGTLSNPQVHTQALPGFSQLLGGWQHPGAGPANHNPRQALFPEPAARTPR